jgi:hypothetical protein
MREEKMGNKYGKSNLYELEKKNSKSNVRPRRKPPARRRNDWRCGSCCCCSPNDWWPRCKVDDNRCNAAKVYRWCAVGLLVVVLQVIGVLFVVYTIKSDNEPAWFWPWIWISVGAAAVLLVICGITGKMIGKGIDGNRHGL